MATSGPVIRAIAETGSTNEDMKALAVDGAPEGTWLRAERQTGGRGRMGRAWEGESGNLFTSTLVRLAPNDPPAPTLALVVAVVVHEQLSEFTGEGVLTIKWPNDIMAGTAKLCGMLLERVDDAIIIGIGANIISAPGLPDRETTSLLALGSSSIDAATLLEMLARRFADHLHRWRTYGIEPLMRAWSTRAHPPGTPLIAQLPDGERVDGRFEALDPGGALILRLADGSFRAIHAGDVFAL